MKRIENRTTLRNLRKKRDPPLVHLPIYRSTEFQYTKMIEFDGKGRTWNVAPSVFIIISFSPSLLDIYTSLSSSAPSFPLLVFLCSFSPLSCLSFLFSSLSLPPSLSLWRIYVYRKLAFILDKGKDKEHDLKMMNRKESLAIFSASLKMFCFSNNWEVQYISEIELSNLESNYFDLL